MDDRTKKALEKSIVKWEKNLVLAKEGSVREISLGTTSCPLCNLFYTRGCEGCPVKRKANIYCANTPYDKVIHLKWEHLHYFKPSSLEMLISAIEEEINFLKSLWE